MAKVPVTDFPVGSRIDYTTGPTRLRFDGHEVIGHDNGFVQVKDEKGRVRKVRPGAIHR